MKEIIIMIALALGMTGCSGSQAQKSTETTKLKTEVTTQAKEDKTEATTEVKVDVPATWDEMVPDYDKIFKGANITCDMTTNTPEAEAGQGGLYITLENATKEQYDKYWKEASKRFTNITTKNYYESDTYATGSFLGDDGVYQIYISAQNDKESKNDKTFDIIISCYKMSEDESTTETK